MTKTQTNPAPEVERHDDTHDDDPLADLYTFTGEPVKFPQVGDKVLGNIQHIARRQMTDINTGKPEVWPARGDQPPEPRLTTIVYLQVDELADEHDDGARILYCNGGKFTALRESSYRQVTRDLSWLSFRDSCCLLVT